MTHVPKGAVPARSQSLATSLATYGVSPPLSLRRIDRYDGHHVTSPERSHKSARGERETVAVSTCIGRMSQHVLPTGCQRVRYAGVQATKTFAKMQPRMHEALARMKGSVKGAIKSIAPMPYRQRSRQSPGRAPVRCPPGHSAMGVWRLWHPTYGVIHEELEAIRRGQYASQAPRAAPTGGSGRTLGPAAREISLSLPGVR